MPLSRMMTRLNDRALVYYATANVPREPDPVLDVLSRLAGTTTIRHVPPKPEESLPWYAGAFYLCVAWRHRHRIPRDVLEAMPCANLHPSLLPFGRGAHPLFWALAMGAPLGVTLHWMDEGIDEGAIIGQALLSHWTLDNTMAEIYDKAERAAAQLLRNCWRELLRFEPGCGQDLSRFTFGQVDQLRHRAAELPAWVEERGWEKIPAGDVEEWGHAQGIWTPAVWEPLSDLVVASGS